MRVSPPWLIAGLLLSIGCLATPGPVCGQAPAQRRAELLQQAHAAGELARNSSFVAALAARFAPAGVHLAPGAGLFRGPSGARAWLERDTLNTRSVARWTVLRHDVSADGRDGYTYGYFDVIRPSGDSLPGKYHAYWRRSEAGQWQILAFARGRRAPGPVAQEFPAALIPRVPPPTRAVIDTTALYAELVATEGAFSDSVGVSVAAGFGGFAAPDAAKLEGGSEYVFGPQAVERLFADPPAGSLGPAWSPEWGSVATSGDLGFTLGPAWRRVPGKVQTPPAVPGGRYFTIWKRQPDGTWRFLVD
jgi:ketosteroid isomerase-like protein